MKVQLNCLLNVLNEARNDTLYISRKVYDLIKPSKKVIYKLHFGKSKSDVLIKPAENKNSTNKNSIYFSSNIFNKTFTDEELSYFDKLVLNIWKKDKNIYLGPVLGIFVKPKRLSVYNNTTTDPVHLEAGIAKNFLCYLFSVDSIDWSNNRVKGLTFVPKLNRWTNIWLPMPDVVYDRGVRFNKNQKDEVKKIRKKFRNDLNIQFINNRDYIGKWKPFKKLLKYDSVAEYLPQTVRYKSFNDLLTMLKSHDFIFLKSYYGSEGKQVMSIEKQNESNKYKIGYYSKGLKEVEVNKKEGLKKYVEKFIKEKKFIIQQGITLLRYKDRPFDLRVLVTKNKNGQWKVISNYVRVASKQDQTITNYSIASNRILYDKIYPSLFDSRSENIPSSNDIESAAIIIASYIDKEFGNFGELGFDLAIDAFGKLWLLEVNTKPSKGLALNNQDSNEIPYMYTAVFDYANYLQENF